MLKFENVTKVFKSDLLTQPFTALDNVSFEVPKGSMVGFLGANGAGKTTSIKIIMDFIRADKGTRSGQVLKVFEAARDAGFTKVTVAGEALSDSRQNQLQQQQNAGPMGAPPSGTGS